MSSGTACDLVAAKLEIGDELEAVVKRGHGGVVPTYHAGRGTQAGECEPGADVEAAVLRVPCPGLELAV